KQSAYAEYNHLSFPLTESIHEEVLSIPMDPTMTDDEIDYVIKKMNEFHV
ncbi:TPA: DegT/DnrJ/EryC1/StrS family aminotransferase, partial [Enterobacter hormaechei]